MKLPSHELKSAPQLEVYVPLGGLDGLGGGLFGMVAHFLVRRFDIHSAALRQQICVSSGEGSDARPTVEPCQAQSCKHAGVECRAKVGLRVLFYFLALGLGYLFVEIVLAQRLVFFLADPV